jgi:hypothetical protein
LRKRQKTGLEEEAKEAGLERLQGAGQTSNRA